jgi:molybdenum cofactor cytidylyltransferase
MHDPAPSPPRRPAGNAVAIVLAAGAGSRFGGRKLLASIEGRPVLQHVLDRLAAAGMQGSIVVLGDDARELQRSITWRDEVRVINPEPNAGLSSSLRIGMAALPADAEAALIVLGDQPRVSPEVIRALLDAGVDEERPVAVPVDAAGDGGRNPVLLGRAGFALVEGAEGDRGLGPVIAAQQRLVREVDVSELMGDQGNPDIDTRLDHIRLLTQAWAARVRANREQVDRIREVPDGADFYAPVTSLFRADPTRTDEPALDALLSHIRAGETWLDIGAGAGRYALPVARALAPSGGRVIAVDTSAAMLAGLAAIAVEHRIENVEVIEARWPPPRVEASRFEADVALIAHVSYDIEDIGTFLAAMEGATRRRCIAMLMERQPSSIADVCWPTVWGEERVSLPALPAFVELLRAMGRDVEVLRIEREPRRFASRAELAGFLRRQLWVADGTAADARFEAALDDVIDVDDDGQVGMRGQRPLPIGIATWSPGRGA